MARLWWTKKKKRIQKKTLPKHKIKTEIFFVVSYYCSPCFRSLVSCFDWIVCPPKIVKIKFNSIQMVNLLLEWVFFFFSIQITSINSPILNCFNNCRASVEWPASSNALVQSLPATSAINSPPPGCYFIVVVVVFFTVDSSLLLLKLLLFFVTQKKKKKKSLLCRQNVCRLIQIKKTHTSSK